MSFNDSNNEISRRASLKLLGSLRRQQLFSQYELFKMWFHLGSLVIPVGVIYERWINIWLSFLLKAAAAVATTANSGILATPGGGFGADI